MIHLPDPAATAALGARLAALLQRAPEGGLLALAGDLGTGKTALVRALLSALGHAGPVVSPTYTLMEPYEAGGLRLMHLDLYRLGTPEELEYLGVRELADTGVWLLVEWPERAAGWLPPAELTISLRHRGVGREAEVRGRGARGRALAAGLAGLPEKPG